MLSLCVNRMIIKVINRKKLSEQLLIIIVQNKTVKDPIIQDSEEYLKIKNIKIQEIPKTIANGKDKAIIIPRYTATPCPPLNFNQTGKICPIKQINADKKTKSLKYVREIITEK